jgi:hypothetical protein
LNGILLLSTLIKPGAPYHLRGLITCVLLLVNIAVYVTVYHFSARDHESLGFVLSLFVACAAAYSLLALGSLVLFELGFGPAQNLVALRDIGDLAMNGGHSPTPRPLLLEPNIGSYLGAIGVIALFRSVFAVGRTRLLFGLASGAIFIGVLLSYSRGAWVGTLVGLVVGGVALIFVRGAAGFSARKLTVVAAVLVASVGLSLLAVPTAKTILLARAANLVNADRGTGQQRLAFWGTITRDALNEPIIGHGVDAYRALLPPRPSYCSFCGAFVAENIVVEVFHGAGAVGLAAYLVLQLSMIALLVRAFIASRHVPKELRALVIAALGGYATIVVCSLFNPSFWGNTYWALWGLFVAFAVTVSRAWPRRLGSVLPISMRAPVGS